MIPESRLIRTEYTIRELALSDDVKLAKKSMIRWLALSLGLVSPKESRTLILDILEILLYSHIKKKRLMFPDIYEKVKKTTKSEPSEKSVYYHLLRLKEKGFLKNKGKEYFLSDEDESLSQVFKNQYFGKIKNSFEKIEKVATSLENSI